MTLITRPRFKLTPNVSAVRGGEGPHMVLIHGVGLSADAWYAMQPELEQSFTVTAIDMPGHGESTALPMKSGASVASFTDVIAESLDSFNEPVVVVGHSMGALISLDLAIRYRDGVSAAVPLNTIFRRSSAASKAIKARAAELTSDASPEAQATLNRWFGDDPKGALLEAQENCRFMLDAANPQNYAVAYQAFAENDGPLDTDIESLATPVLCLTGEKEPNSTPEMSQTLASKLPNGDCGVIKNALHMMPITHAVEVNRCILQFLTSRELVIV